MTESGFAMPPDHIVFQMASTLDFRSPVIMGVVVPETGRGSERGRGMPSPVHPLKAAGDGLNEGEGSSTLPT